MPSLQCAPIAHDHRPLQRSALPSALHSPGSWLKVLHVGERLSFINRVKCHSETFRILAHIGNSKTTSIDGDASASVTSSAIAGGSVKPKRIKLGSRSTKASGTPPAQYLYTYPNPSSAHFTPIKYASSSLWVEIFRKIMLNEHSI